MLLSQRKHEKVHFFICRSLIKILLPWGFIPPICIIYTAQHTAREEESEGSSREPTN